MREYGILVCVSTLCNSNDVFFGTHPCVKQSVTACVNTHMHVLIFTSLDFLRCSVTGFKCASQGQVISDS